MDEFAPVCKFTYMQNNLHMCKFGHENGAFKTVYAKRFSVDDPWLCKYKQLSLCRLLHTADKTLSY